MIAISPTYMVNTYRSIDDFYKISAVRRASSIRQGASRSSLPSPFLRSAYNESAKTAAAGLSGLLKSAQSVQQSAQIFLRNHAATTLNQRVAVSSKPDKLTAEVKSGSALKSFHVQVNTVATGQYNAGISSTNNAGTPMQAGWNEFSLKQDGETISFKVFVGANDSFEQTIGKVRSAINQETSRVRAVVVDDEGSKSHLQVTSSQMGSKQAFTFEDMSGNAVSALGLNQTQQNASNASYSIDNGPVQTSQSNEVELNNGDVKLALHKTDSESITVTTQPDSVEIIKPIKELILTYNQFQQTLHDTPGYLNRSVVQSLEQSAKPQTLDQLGISENSDGTLTLDEITFKQQLTDHYADVKRSISGVSGLASSLSQSFGRLDQLPSETLFQQSQLKSYLPLPMTGLLLDRVM